MIINNLLININIYYIQFLLNLLLMQEESTFDNKFGSLPEFVVCGGGKTQNIQFARIKDHNGQTKMIPFKQTDNMQDLKNSYYQMMGKTTIVTFYYPHDSYNVPIQNNILVSQLPRGSKAMLIAKKGICFEYKFLVKIESPKNSFQLQCKNTNKIKVLQAQIQQRLNLKQKKLNVELYFNNRYLERTETLEHYEITLNSVIIAEIKSYSQKDLQRYPIITSNEKFSIRIKVIDDANPIQLQMLAQDSLQNLKKKIFQKKEIPVIQQKLMFEGREIRQNENLRIYKNKTLNLVVKIAGGCFRKNTQILQKLQPFIEYSFIQNLKVGDTIISFNQVIGQASASKIKHILKQVITDMVKISLINNEIIECTPNHLFLISQGKWLKCQIQNMNEDILRVGSLLHTIQKPIQIHSIEWIKLQYPETFYHLCLEQHHTFIVNSVITHNMQIFIQFLNGKIISIDASPTDLVNQIKNKISQKCKINQEGQKLFYAGKELLSGKSLSDYNIHKGSTINLIEQSEKIKTIGKSFKSNQADLIIEPKQICLTIRPNESIIVGYSQSKFMKAESFVAAHSPNEALSSRLMYGQLILDPTHKISVIQDFYNIFPERINMILIPSGEKIVFSEVLMRSEKTQISLQATIANSQNSRDKQIRKKIQERNIPDPFKPLAYYTSDNGYRRVNQRLRDFSPSNQPIHVEDDFLNLSFSIINSLEKLPAYYGLVYRGIHNFYLSSTNLINKQYLFFQGFVSTSKSKEVALRFLKKKGTLLLIKSLTGKQISNYSLYKNQQEVLFPPFTYFFIDKIEHNQEVQVFWMTELPSPVTFCKDIIVWVDDEPQKNKGYIQRNNDIQFLQLISTKMAEIWIKQFGWILHWKGVKFKVISDMVRKEDQIYNYFAGIDLIEKFYNQFGVTPEIFIFCSDTQRAKENAQERKINKNRIFKISSKPEQLKQFVMQGKSMRKHSKSSNQKKDLNKVQANNKKDETCQIF